jgi:hypothetical protein
MKLAILGFLPLLLAGCFSAPRTFYDVECRTQIPEGVSVALLTLDSTVFLSSTFGGESIHVGFGRPFPDTILVGWRGSPHAMYKRRLRQNKMKCVDLSMTKRKNHENRQHKTFALTKQRKTMSTKANTISFF